MRKRVAKKLSLNRETIHRLTDSTLGRVGGALADVVAPAPALSITECTQIISDCLGCTTPLASCPATMFSDCTCA